MRREWAIVGAGGAYLLALGVAISRIDYDLWGAMVVGPVIIGVSVPILRRVFGPDQQILFAISVAGLFAKLGGSLARYWVAFDAYDGGADAAAYHRFAARTAQAVRDGEVSPTEVLPIGQGTNAIERLTAGIYLLAGSSRLAGFFIFAWCAFWGAVLFVRAAMIAVPGLDARRYAALVFFLPSLVYWPSSIGKEAWLMLCLGLASYGAARLFAGGWSATGGLCAGVGLVAAAQVRPHVAAMWALAAAIALGIRLVATRSARNERARLSDAVLVAAAVIGCVLAAATTLEYLDPAPRSGQAVDEPAGVTDRIEAIFDKTERQTGQGGSSFQTISIDDVQDWPVAIVRTLTRPTPLEASGPAQMLAAVEMLGLALVAAVRWRRLAALPRLVVRVPYVAFAVSILVMFGISFARIGNLGILTRQRSLVLPFLVLCVCVPTWAGWQAIARRRSTSTSTSGITPAALPQAASEGR